MIFVITGMEVHPFDRLIRAVDALHATGTMGEDFFVQLGSCTYEPRHAAFERFMSFGDLCDRVRSASVVVTHAGAGSTLTCIQQGKHPIMVPRYSKEREHVDDHQLPFTQKLCDVGLATALYDVTKLAETIETVRGRTAALSTMRCSPELIGWLEQFWAKLRE